MPEPNVYQQIRKLMAEQWEEATQPTTTAMYDSAPPEPDPPDEPQPQIEELPDQPLPAEVPAADSVQAPADSPVDEAEQIPIELPPELPDPEMSQEPAETLSDVPEEPVASDADFSADDPGEPLPPQEVPTEDEPEPPLPPETAFVSDVQEPVPSDVPDPDDDEDDEFDFPGDVELEQAGEIPLPPEREPQELPELAGEYLQPEQPEQWEVTGWDHPESRAHVTDTSEEFDRELARIGLAPIEETRQPGAPDNSDLVHEQFSILNARSVL